jgi:sporulation protein YlmC with PRC-barrel domain
MRPTDPIKLVSQLLDLPIQDRDGRWCGVVDDVELDGRAGAPMRIKALLVGPGAYQGRLPAWLFWVVGKIAGQHVSRVPLDRIDKITSTVRLNCTAEKVGLHKVEDRVRGWIPRGGAL